MALDIIAAMEQVLAERIGQGTLERLRDIIAMDWGPEHTADDPQLAALKKSERE